MNQNKVIIMSKCCSKLEDMQLSWDITASCDEETLLKDLESIEEDNLAPVFCTFNEKNQIAILQNQQMLQYISHLIGTGVPVVKIEKLLKQISLNELVEYQIIDTQEVLLDDRIDDDYMGTYLKYFLEDHLDDEELIRLWAGLRWFESKKKSLSEDWIGMIGSKRTIFMEPIIAGSYLDNISDCDKCIQLLAKNEDMVTLLSMFYQVDYEEAKPDDENIKEIDQNTKRLLELWIWAKEEFFNQNQLKKFLAIWLKNHALLNDLEKLKRKAKAVKAADMDYYLVGKASYIAFFYNEILPEGFDSTHEEVLIYAIIHKKRAFLKLVRENLELFRNISSRSVLFCHPFYDKCLNINTMNKKNLEACNNMLDNPDIMWSLLCNREHTFDELLLIHGLSKEYVQLYETLSVDRVDDRIRIMREIVKKHCLHKGVNLAVLAKELSKKSLLEWKQTDLKHINGLSDESAVCLLGEYETLAHLIPDITSNAEVRYILDNLGQCLEFSSMTELRQNILEINNDWKYLVDIFGFSEKFVSENKQRIEKFIYENGAYIIKIYHETNIEKTEELRRLVSAELMGRFKELKYYRNDLSLEIDYPITERQRECWIKNEKEEIDAMSVWEEDGLIPVMNLGTIPYHTCLSYVSGEYAQCLLACHDSNKKVLYLSCNGKIVLRASIRLTKGTYCEKDKLSGRKPLLQFVDFMEDEEQVLEPDRYEEQEHLTLFLEHAYIAGLSQEMIKKACKLIIQLMRRKAAGMNALLVISDSYLSYMDEDVFSGYYSMYISKSKAGAQYLDSLGGNNCIDKEGSYRRERFLFYKQKGEANYKTM